MSRFVQLHVLTSYPPSNPNRDDLGRPKTALLGNVPRMRISSQAIKRAVRSHPEFRTSLEGKLGERTQRLGDKIAEHLCRKGADVTRSTEIARQVASAFGKIKGEKDANPTQIEQLAFISPEEKAFAFELADRIAAGESLPKDKELAKIVLRKADSAVDIAMFGRMLADSSEFNRDAAVQVAHATTVNRVEIESDYYTALDDLKEPSEDAGAGFVGEAGFAAGVFYLYVCVNRPLLLENLAGDRELAGRSISALVSALSSASPTGKQNSFANRVRAEFILAERGDQQPRSLASAFIEPVDTGNQIDEAANRLMAKRADFAKVYGSDWDADIRLHVGKEDSATLEEVARFCADGLDEEDI